MSWGILGKIFGTDTVIKKGMNLIDEAFYTDEEEAQDKLKAKNAKTDNKVKLLGAYAPFKVAQRFLAISFSSIYLLSFVGTIIMNLAGYDTHKVTDILDNFAIQNIVLIIVTFYFGGGLLEGTFNSKKKEVN